MRVITFLSAAEADPVLIAGSTAVVIDVIRATSTIVEALASGARSVYPTLSSDDAIQLANSLGREDTLLCGERRGLKIEGFDLGNSPTEFTRKTVGGKRLVMSTTNGTRAFLAAEGADRVFAASLLNLSSVAEAIRDVDNLVFICAGKEDRFSLDDALCAGLVLRNLFADRHGPSEREPVFDDASAAVFALADSHVVDADLLRTTAAGAALNKVGLGADLELCAETDRHSLVPQMHDRVIRLAEGS